MRLAAPQGGRPSCFGFDSTSEVSFRESIAITESLSSFSFQIERVAELELVQLRSSLLSEGLCRALSGGEEQHKNG